MRCVVLSMILIVSGFELARVSYGELRISNPIFASAEKYPDLEGFHRMCAEMISRN
jgi:hypothetical protein